MGKCDKSHRIKATEMWWVSCMSAYYFKFYFPHACIRPFLPINYKRLQMFSMWLQNRDKTETQNALCNFSKSPHMCKLPNYMAWCIMRLVHFAIYTQLAFLRLWVSVAYQVVYAVLACMGVECVRAWACLTVLCICNCRCKIYYTL